LNPSKLIYLILTFLVCKTASGQILTIRSGISQIDDKATNSEYNAFGPIVEFQVDFPIDNNVSFSTSLNLLNNAYNVNELVKRQQRVGQTNVYSNNKFYYKLNPAVLAGLTFKSTPNEANSYVFFQPQVGLASMSMANYDYFADGDHNIRTFSNTKPGLIYNLSIGLGKKTSEKTFFEFGYGYFGAQSRVDSEIINGSSLFRKYEEDKIFVGHKITIAVLIKLTNDH
jgi:hypothetical protein